MQIDLSQQAKMLATGYNVNQGGEYFGPGAFMQPNAPAGSGWGRTTDYPLSSNTTFTPKAVDGGLTYRQLRALAENCNYVAIMIQAVIDRLCATKGRVVDVGGDASKPSAKAEQINEWAQALDGRTPLREFLGMACYDMCVLDAATAYVDLSSPGKPIAYNVDGATITLGRDERGRVAGVGQVLKGTVAHWYSPDQMIFMPKNRRPHKLYGWSFVNQINDIVDLALRRTARQMDWFTKGSIPDVLITAPTTWQPDQVRDVNQNWDKQMAGIGGKSMARYIPGGSEVHELNRNPIVSEFDEWLMRVIAYAFNEPATAFVKQMNRSTSETLEDSSASGGQAAVRDWAGDFLTSVIRAAWGPGYRWQWMLAEPTKEDIVKLMPSGMLDRSVLKRFGFAEGETKDPPAAPQIAAKPEDDKTPAQVKEEPEGKAAKVKNADAADDLESAVQGYLDELKEEASAVAVARFKGEVAELIGPKPRPFVMSFETLLRGSTVDGINEASLTTAKAPANLSNATRPAEAWARERAAEMVGMKWDGSKLIPNPDAQWQISEMARDAIRTRVADAFENGSTVQQLAQDVAGDNAFSPRRARNIARTETATAQEVGSLSYYKAAGVPMKKWSDFDGCPICKANAAQGPIKIDAEFRSGHQHAPAHPGGCRCRVIPVEVAE